MDIGGGSSLRGGEVSTTRPPQTVCEDQSDRRKGTGSRRRWRSGLSPPGEFDPLTVPLLVQKDSNNSSSSSEEENKQPNDDGDGEATLALKVNQEFKIRWLMIDVGQRPSPIHPSIIEPHVNGHVMLHTHD